ncbi:MAG: dTDP-4-dehydrorhamnose reductase [Actinomycetota bacterium]|nr:dTDP-4-dehydrorhamnose reductase [Actinomycetota bacterium]
MTDPVTGWLVTGGGGMLGRELAGVLASDGSSPVHLADRGALDVTDPEAVEAAVGRLGPRGVVLNAAGWTNVDAAEDHEEEASAVNGAAVRSLAAVCSDAGATLVHVSTDYVFGAADQAGSQPSPSYAEDAPTAPINAYGRGKLDGELGVLELCPDSGYVLRTAWLYGRHGRNFVSTMLGLAATHATVSVVDDQVGQPTWTLDLARRMVEIGHRPPKPGIYHATAQGETSWYGLARAAFAEAGLDPDRVLPVHTEAFPRPAARPARSVLGHDAWATAGMTPLDPWRAMLTRAYRAGTFAQ